MSYGVKSALPVVRCNAVHRGKLYGTANGNGRYTSTNDIAENFVSHLCAASRHDQPIDAMIRECLQAGSFVMDATAGCGDKCGVSGLIKDLPYTVYEFRGEGIGDVGQEDANGVQVADPELTGHHIRPVIQFLHGLRDALTYLGAYITGLIDRPGGSHGDHPRHPGHVRKSGGPR